MTAYLLVAARDLAAYQRGDVIEVRDQRGYDRRGRLEGPPNFAWVRVDDENRAALKALARPKTVTVEAPDGAEEVIVRRREHAVTDAVVDQALRGLGATATMRRAVLDSSTVRRVSDAIRSS